ncbi:MAG: aminoacetone oxidase family FAD-binding enzyme [Planctomycetota bacterium]
MTSRRIIVIGAGAAGMLAAAEAARRGADVTILEKNSKAGVKILMSGGTRCNITQNTDAKGIAEAFGRGGRFLQKSVGAFGPNDVVQMFHDAGVATKVEATGKVFPQSDRALHVRDALQRLAINAGANLHLRSPVESFHRDGNEWHVTANGETLACDRLIVTSGGRSWPGCGTTGDGYGWLSRLGHTIVPPRPALVPLVGGYAWTRELSGLTLDECEATVHERADRKRKPLVRRRSSWLFTHFGFSGPAAMDVSGVLTAADSLRDVVLSVDLLPQRTTEEITAALTDRDRGRRGIETVLADWLPNRLATALATHHHSMTSIAELPKKSLLSLVNGIKRAEMPVEGTRGFAKAEVTAGGVALPEVDPRTMASRIMPGLYIAGEVLDVDGWIGGYNFQAAFSTGRAAGIAAALDDQ